MRTIKNNLEVYKLFAERYTYDPSTGTFTHKVTGNSDRKPDSQGYISLCIYKKGMIKGHRLAWFISYGEMPPTTVDHINEDKADNRLCNLQLLSQRQNTIKAIKAKGGTTSQYAGVCWKKDRNKWAASIFHPSGKLKHLGYFKNEFVAANAYANALNSLAE